jgi:hypothetical protein
VAVAAGLHDIEPSRGPQFNHESMAVQAAIDGYGVALVGDVLVADYLADGRLVRPFDPSFSTPLNYAYLFIERKRQHQTAQGHGVPRVVAKRGTRLASEHRRGYLRLSNHTPIVHSIEKSSTIVIINNFSVQSSYIVNYLRSEKSAFSITT